MNLLDKKKLWEAVKPHLKVLLETVKFPLRVAILSILPILSDHFLGLGYIWVAKVIGILIVLDKYIYELRKGKDIKWKGLAPF